MGAVRRTNDLWVGWCRVSVREFFESMVTTSTRARHVQWGLDEMVSWARMR